MVDGITVNLKMYDEHSANFQITGMVTLVYPLFVFDTVQGEVPQ
jgi:hypothetical protein